jgi:NAD(P)-dependent dehydrogenase (short-subunit alcohol dehydrogenase family)
MVTGAASGIGLGIARAFAAQGATLALVDRDRARLDAVARELPGARAFACDLASNDAVACLARDVREHLPALRVLVNNAGAEYPTPIDDPAPEAIERWSSLLDNNVTSMARLTRALLPAMPSGASIVNQASIWGLSGVAGFSAYVASKHAIVGLTRALAWELAPRGIRVNAVCPGWIRTDASLRSLAAMAAASGRSEAEELRDILANQAMPAFLDPADIAGIYLFLASGDARAITGQSRVASNGELMH